MLRAIHQVILRSRKYSAVAGRFQSYSPSSAQYRTMSSESKSADKQEWIVILPDNTGVLKQRMQVRQ